MESKVRHKGDLSIRLYEEAWKDFEKVRDSLRILWGTYKKFNFPDRQATEDEREKFMDLILLVFSKARRHSCYALFKTIELEYGSLCYVAVCNEGPEDGIRMSTFIKYKTGKGPDNYLVLDEPPSVDDSYLSIEQ